MYERGENDLEVDMYIEEWQLQKDERRVRNFSAHKDKIILDKLENEMRTNDEHESR